MHQSLFHISQPNLTRPSIAYNLAQHSIFISCIVQYFFFVYLSIVLYFLSRFHSLFLLDLIPQHILIYFSIVYHVPRFYSAVYFRLFIFLWVLSSVAKIFPRFFISIFKDFNFSCVLIDFVLYFERGPNFVIFRGSLFMLSYSKNQYISKALEVPIVTATAYNIQLSIDSIAFSDLTQPRTAFSLLSQNSLASIGKRKFLSLKIILLFSSLTLIFSYQTFSWVTFLIFNY